MAVSDRRPEWLLYLTILLAVVVALALFSQISVVFAVKGSYVLAGTIIAGVAFFATRRYGGTASGVLSAELADRDANRAAKAVVILVGLSYAPILLTEFTVPVLATVLSAGYLLLYLQLRAGTGTRLLLFQTVLLFTLVPVSKYATTDFYFGSGDILHHVGYARELVAAGSTAGISSTYSSFPGLHLLTATVHLVTGLPVYDSLLSTGLAYSSFFTLPLVFLFAYHVSRDARFAVLTTVMASTVTYVVYYTTYFFAQALAVPLFLFLVYLAYRIGPARRSLRSAHWTVLREAPRWSLVALLVVLSILPTHHLTVILFTPVVVLLLAGTLAVERFGGNASEGDGIAAFNAVPPVASIVLAPVYWSLFSPGLIPFVIWSVDQVVSRSLFFSSAGGGTRTYVFGLTPAAPPVASIDLVYYTALLALFVTGVLTLVESHDRYRRVLPLAVVGVLGSVTVLKTPLAVKSIGRIGFVFGFFFSFVTAAGCNYLLDASDGTRGRAVLLAVLLVTVGTFGPLLAPDVMDAPLDPRRSEQSSYTDSELRQLQAASGYVRSTSGQVSAFWISNWTIEMYGVEGTSPSVSQRGFHAPEGLFLYRENWADHVVGFRTGSLYLERFLVSESYLDNLIARQNKVYDGGSVGLLWNRKAGFLGRSPSRARATADDGNATADRARAIRGGT